MAAFLTLCGGFLLAVLWFDLMFDTLASRRLGETPSAPALDSITAYYGRVTATPMRRLVAVAMAGAVGGTLYELVSGTIPRLVSATALAACAVPVGLALTRVFPNAERLGRRTDPLDVQGRLARSIYHDHLACLAAMTLFCALQLLGR